MILNAIVRKNHASAVVKKTKNALVTAAKIVLARNVNAARKNSLEFLEKNANAIIKPNN